MTEQETPQIKIISTSHLSEESAEKVKQAIDTFEPDIVGLELDTKRRKKLTESTQKPSFKNIFQLDTIRSQGIFFVLLNALQVLFAKKLDIDIIGIDMKAGYTHAVERNIPVALVDRDIETTIHRLRENMPLTELIKVISFFMFTISVLAFRSIKHVSDMSEAKDSEQINDSLQLLEDHLPSVKTVLIDERNTEMAENMITLAQEHTKSIVVVGAAHEPGVKEILTNSEDVTVITE